MHKKYFKQNCQKSHNDEKEIRCLEAKRSRKKIKRAEKIRIITIIIIIKRITVVEKRIIKR